MNQQPRDLPFQIIQRPPLVALLTLVLLLCNLSFFLNSAPASTPFNAGFMGQWEHLVIATNPDNSRIQQNKTDTDSDGSPDLPLWLLGAVALLIRREPAQRPPENRTTPRCTVPPFRLPPLRAPPLA